MEKIAFIFALLLCCGSTFAFDQVVGDITPDLVEITAWKSSKTIYIN